MMMKKVACIALCMVLVVSQADAQLGGVIGVIGPIGAGLTNCDPTKLAPCVSSILQLRVIPPSNTCCSSLAAQLSCFCQFEASLQQLLSSTVGQLLTVACGVGAPPTCT